MKIWEWVVSLLGIKLVSNPGEHGIGSQLWVLTHASC